MCKSFYRVLFSAVVLVVALSFASTVAAQEESTSEETTMLAADAENTQVEVKTDNVTVEREDGKVSAKTSNVSTSNESQQSSLTVQQNQADEGSGSRATTGTLNTDQQATTQATSRLNGKTASFRDTDDDALPDEVVISGLRNCTTADSQQVSVTVRQALSGQDPIQVEFTDDEVDVSSTQIVITGSDVNDFEVGTGTVESSSGITCENNNRNNNNRNNDNDRNNRVIRINRNNDDDNRGAARRQYGDTEVIVKTIPDKGRLADTGGSPLILLAGAALLSTGLLVGRSVFRRDP